MAGQRARRITEGCDFLLKGFPVLQDGVRPGDHALALRRQAMKAVASFDDGDAKLLFELTDPTRERRLRDAALLCRAGEVLLPGEGDEVLQLADIHRKPLIREHKSLPKTNRRGR